jgi:hypothetical protein
MKRHGAWLSLMVLFPLALGCGGGDSTGSNGGGSTFPPLPSSLLTQFCVRGNRLPGQATSGTIGANDCDAADFDPTDDGYFEVWRVRVLTSGTYTITISSNFDSWLEVYQLNSTSPLDLTLIDQNDDRIPGVDLDGEVTVQLDPGVDYMVGVSGYDYAQTGPYTLTIQ